MNNNRPSNTVPFRRNGRFCKFKPDTQDSLLKATKRDVYNARKERLKNELFDKFVDLFFLKENAKDGILTSWCSGPIVALAEIIFKRSYLLQRNSRSEKLHLIYAGGDARNVKPITKRRLTRDASLNAGPKSRVKIFSARRLPCIEKYSTEVQPVKEWLEELLGLGALKKNCLDQVFGECIGIIKSYVKVEGNYGYVGYPKALKKSGGIAHANITTQPASIRASPDPSPRSPDPNTESDMPTHNQTSDEGSEESVCDKHMQLFVEMALNDETYSLFCVIFDENLEHQFDVASGLYLMNKRDEESRMVPYCSIRRWLLGYSKRANHVCAL